MTTINLRPQYSLNNYIKHNINKNNSDNDDKNNNKKNDKKNDNNKIYNNSKYVSNKTCFFEKNLKFIQDFKKEFIDHSIDHNLYQLIIEICTYVNDKKNYSYDYIIYDINCFFDLYNKTISTIDNDYLIQFITNIKNNFCLNKYLIDKINLIINNLDLEENITSPDFEEESFNLENNYFKHNAEFQENLEIEDIEYSNYSSNEEY